MNVKDLETIINAAIETEIEAYEFYMAAAEKMQDASARSLFLELAEEEKGHREILSKLDLANFEGLSSMKQADFGLAKQVSKPKLSVDMNFQEAVALAMKNEEEAMQLYAS